VNEEGVHEAPVQPRSAVEFRVLGPIEALVDGQNVALGGPRQQALLGLLLLHPGRTVPTDVLIDAIWAGEPPDGAATTIRSYVSKLRGALGEAAPVRGNASGYSISVEPVAIDSLIFERLVRDADEVLRQAAVRRAEEHLERALALWRGKPYGELAEDGPLRVEADRLEELRLHALEQRFDAALTLGRTGEIVDELEATVALHPYRERLWRLLMLALYHSGRQADALAAYHRARTMLDDQLGIDPSTELQALEGQILRQEVPALVSTGRRDHLPNPLTSFVGREREKVELANLFASHRLVTLTGVGGVGKTRLAIEVARVAVDVAIDGVVFVDLAPITSDDAVAMALARVLGVREQASMPAVDLITGALRHSRVIVLLDNAEHVRGGVSELADALRTHCPEVRVIVTSRIPIGSQGEIDFPVLPMPVPDESATPEDLRASDSVRLLVQRVMAARPDGVPDDRSLVEAARICRDLDGLPLAIELAAARAKAMTLHEIAGRLDDRYRFLVSWRRVSPARHQTLKQAIDWSFDLLSPADQTFFAKLAVFAGGFTLEAAAVSAEGDELQALEAVTRLVDASLVVAEASDVASRYRMLETVRQYADARLRETGGLNASRDAHANYFRNLAERAEPELTGAAQTLWFERLDVEHANFVAALDHLANEGRGEGLLEFTVALTRFWYVRGHLIEARQALERALTASPSAPTLLRRRGLTATASIALLQGDYGVATRFAEASLMAARESGEERLIANGLSNLGAIVLAAGDNDRAGELLQEAVALARAVEDSRILALALNNMGDHALTVGEYARAEPLFSESLSLLQARGDTANVARSLFNLGAVALMTNHVDAAEERLQDSLAASRETGDQEDLCWGLLGLAAVAAARGQAEKAALLLGAATSVLARMGADFKPFERQLHEQTERSVVELLGLETYESARVRGGSMSLEDAVGVAARA
jgi:predicted ATPase/DNA-binding SARP family transcriptional activator/Tfp pilus assembly protein PilF